MALSSLSVVGNANRLRRYRPPRPSTVPTVPASRLLERAEVAGAR
jgi:hypothetical protein